MAPLLALSMMSAALLSTPSAKTPTASAAVLI